MKEPALLRLAAAGILVNTDLPFGTTDYDSAILSDSPVSYWPMQETMGPTTQDAGGTNNGTMMIGTHQANMGNFDTNASIRSATFPFFLGGGALSVWMGFLNRSQW